MKGLAGIADNFNRLFELEVREDVMAELTRCYAREQGKRTLK